MKSSALVFEQVTAAASNAEIRLLLKFELMPPAADGEHPAASSCLTGRDKGFTCSVGYMSFNKCSRLHLSCKSSAICCIIFI